MAQRQSSNGHVVISVELASFQQVLLLAINERVANPIDPLVNFVRNSRQPPVRKIKNDRSGFLGNYPREIG